MAAQPAPGAPRRLAGESYTMRARTLYVSHVHFESIVRDYTAEANGDLTGLQQWILNGHVCRWLDHVGVHGILHTDTRVLELGAGVGACGLAAACYARRVCLTDASAEAMRIAAANRDSQRELFVSADAIATGVLHWTASGGTVPDADFNATLDSHAGFDLVLGCELLYHNTAADVLMETAERLMDSAGVLVLAFHVRVPGTVEALVREASVRGFVLRFVDLDEVGALPCSNPSAAPLRLAGSGNYFVLAARATEPAALARLQAFVGTLRCIDVDVVLAQASGSEQTEQEALALLAVDL